MSRLFVAAFVFLAVIVGSRGHDRSMAADKSAKSEKSQKSESSSEKPKYKIKEIMETCMMGDDSLVKKIVQGTASDDDKRKVLEMVQSLPGNKPPKGTDESWQEKTKTLIEAAQAVVDGKKRGVLMLKNASNCNKCHESHKPSDY